MKKTFILGIIIALSMTACGKPTQAETTPTTEIKTTEEVMTTIETTEAASEATPTSRGMTDQDEAIMNRIRQDVVDGVTRGSVIEEEVEMWCSDFLDDEQKDEFISELHLLEKDEAEVVVQPKETKASTKAAPKETQSPQPKETQAQVQETQPAPQETQPAPKETQAAPTGNGNYNAVGGGSVQRGTLSSDPSYSPEELEGINNTHFN